MTSIPSLDLPPDVVLPAGSRILDLGCGTGLQARALAAQGHRVVAVDPDVDAVTTAMALARDEGFIGFEHFEHGTGPLHLAADGRALPFPDGTFDAVWCGDVLHWLPDAAALERFMGEGWRVLRPGGVWAGSCRIRLPDEDSAAGRATQSSSASVAACGGASAGWRPPAREELDAFLHRAGGRWLAAPEVDTSGESAADGPTVSFAARKD